ncbi:helix-turn-helix transcriptional regulator [Streptomyces sp. G7(2002)]|uniref:helix-turn-helix transcriptional regulator n=1 Tax=Streptomyces sp. G7(2002) TaxID=2971798 RepID=UPI00237D46C5|nr:helix-turn-helix transcriptional regulator [Streptomyces sp. G7(2002)]WDT57729.1 AAA family ATPase [Streptomyces sp. G7(2002)]
MLSSVETRSVSPVFVGRAAELAVLGDALDHIAASGEPQALLIGGEAGVGKTRLIEEFGELARARGALVALGGCIEIGSEGLPFAPFSAILHTLNWHLRDELAAAVAGQEGELSRILPELGETPGEAHDEEIGRARLFELTARLLERLAAHRTLVLVVEDLHWADRSTRELLAYLLKALHDANVLLVATYRSDDIHRRHPLRPFLAEIDRMRTVRRVELARFNREEVRSQIAGINGSEPEEDTVDRVYKRSEGNAFFVEELARGLADGCLHGLSDPLRDLLLVRVEALPEDAQRVVRTAAEGGSTVEHELLAAVCRMPEDDLIEALRAAVGSNTLVPTQDGTGYRFRHALAREAVVDDLLPGERTRLNRRYAEALEANPSLVRTEVCAARLASYWYKAHDAAKALPAVLAASVQARRRHAYAEQLRLLDRALELWDDAPKEVRQGVRPVDYAEAYPACGCDDGDALRFLDLLAEIAVAARLSGDNERAFTITKRALRSLRDENDPPPSSQHGSSRGDPLRKAWFLVQRSRLCQSTGRGNGWADLGAAQELVRGLPPSSVHAEVMAAVASWAVLHEPGPDTLATAERAVELAQLVGDKEAELNSRLTLAGLRVDSGEVEEGLADFRTSLDRAVCRGYFAVIARGHVNLPSALEGVGRSREAVEVTERGVELTTRYGLKDSTSWVLGNRAESLQSLGRWKEAGRAVADARRLAQSHRAIALAASRRIDLALNEGDLAEAERELAVAQEHYGTHDPQPQHAIVMAQHALRVAARQGRLLDARSILQQALDAGFPPGTHRYAWPLLWAATTAEADARGLPAAEPGRAVILARIRDAAKRLPQLSPVWSAYGLAVDAELRRAEGRETPDAWAGAVAAFEPLERPHELARACYRWAESLLHGSERATAGLHGRTPREAAVLLLTQAHTAAVTMGARPLADELELLAQRARIPLPGLTPADTAGTAGTPAGNGRAATQAPAPSDTAPAASLGLTPRERDVLRLVADGRSNRQIADALFISPKTASVHVSNILAKLGVSGRGEAGAVAHRLRLFGEPTPG